MHVLIENKLPFYPLSNLFIYLIYNTFTFIYSIMNSITMQLNLLIFTLEFNLHYYLCLIFLY